ncbi:Glyceraldehyde-3-phosphate dehydrogenase [Ascidiaceihabitans donghaensis]|uniref:Glyceraldehyde-3-phosphate dehydrogenase n=1 Tax=Ascidiaceihabitans donghaensis TaxID=1510460 RepID=A0A2R8BD28_9RHOB|nr:type I glyceraldehyde-3-phosphate dehydrogenase [Ascidiaceihabitans donghaensis]SPH20934.1 Glyceraldehyde-3-phosphate dehydrogenase [Ascidiaceihabitans donghaensis]
MTITLGINGFGRIGRSILRAILESGRDDLRVVAINDLADLENMAHLLEFDSVHGRLRRPIATGDGVLDVGTGPIRVTHVASPDALPWQDVDIALECTGHFRTAALAGLHLKNGAGKVLVSAPAKINDIKTVVMGVNDAAITADDTILSNGSCTTNCLAPVAHLLHEAYGIVRGTMTTVHCYTGVQPVHDAYGKTLNRARAASLSMIPTTTGAAEAVEAVLPHLKGRLFGTSIRVPVPNVSCIDLTVEVQRETSTCAVNALFSQAAHGPMARIMAVTSTPMVSVDLNHDPMSATVALDQTHVQDKTMIRVLAWYDNEWGFSNRMIDMAERLALS